MRVPWTARRSNQSTLKEINPEYSLEELMLKLKLQYFGHLMRRTDSLEKTLMLGKIEGRKRGEESRHKTGPKVPFYRMTNTEEQNFSLKIHLKVSIFLQGKKSTINMLSFGQDLEFGYILRESVYE